MDRINKGILLVFVLISTACTGSGSNVADDISNFFRGGSGQQSPGEEELVDVDSLVQPIIDATNTRDYGTALAALETYKEHPGHDYYWAQYIDAYIANRLGHFDEALRLVNLLSPGPYHTDLLKLRADIYYSMHRVDGARADLETIALTGVGADSMVLFMLWVIAGDKGEIDRLREIEAELGARNSLDANDMFFTCEQAMLDRDFDRASRALDRLPNLPSTLDSPFESFYDPRILVERGRLAFERGEIDRALAIFEGVPDEYPCVTSSFQVLAGHALMAGRYELSRSWAIEGIIRAGGADVLGELGITEPQSIADIECPSGPVRHIEVAALLITVGHTALATGGIAEAVACAEKAKEINPYETQAYSLESCAHEMTGDLSGAIRAAAEGLRIDPLCVEIAIQYSSLAQRAPHEVFPSGAPPDAVLGGAINRVGRFYRAYPLDPDSAHLLGLALRVAGEEGSDELFAYAYGQAPFRWSFRKDYAEYLAESGDVTGARAVLDGYEMPTDLAWLFEMYNRVNETGSESLGEFADWVRAGTDPENRFAPLLDPLSAE